MVSKSVARRSGPAVIAALLACGVAWVAGAPEPRAPSQQERDLVAAVYKSREAYQASLERLRAYYLQAHREDERASVEKELTDLHRIVKAPYILDMDLPDADLRPDTSVANANRIFREALAWLEKPTLGSQERRDNTMRAELLLRRLLRDYPRSDKLDEACYYLGEIYASRYFDQPQRAVAFYERVFHYEPNTNLDARLRAAQIYERDLSNHQRAVELYEDVLRREIDPLQTREARRRLDDLLERRRRL